jgi:hypothetical protein
MPADPRDAEWGWVWGWGSEPERYYISGNSREAALEEALTAAKRDGIDGEVTICEGRPEVLTDKFFDADNVLEEWHDANEERQDEDGELSMSPSAQQKADLEKMLAEAFAAWRRKHGLGRAWTLETRKAEVVAIPEPPPAAWVACLPSEECSSPGDRGCRCAMMRQSGA